jgi:HSP20 family protein
MRGSASPRAGGLEIAAAANIFLARGHQVLLPGTARRYFFASTSVPKMEMNMNLYSTRYPTDLFGELDRLQQQIEQAFRGSATDIRATGRGAFPAINVGATDEGVEIIALAPGIDPKKIDLTIEKGVLTISGERAAGAPPEGRATIYARERFSGAFRRVINLPEDADPDRVSASYRDGCLRVSIARRESSKPRSIQIH